MHAPRNPNRSPIARRSAGIFWLWLAIALVVAAAVTFIERRALLVELDNESAALVRLASQRADQHDAHLTSLSAVALAGRTDWKELFLEVSATVRRFYPRIVAIDLLPMRGGPTPLGTGAEMPVEVATVLRRAARASDGELKLATIDAEPGVYYLVKRSPNSDAAVFALVLKIDARALVASDSRFWIRPAVTRSLRMPDGKFLVGPGTKSAPQFSRTLGSVSQPLVLETSIAPRGIGLLPLGRIALAVALISALYLLGLLALRQFALTKRAERQATLSAQEARIAHVSRVNALGEMASGIAHELTQPLTAILAQAQASQHLLTRGETAAIRPVLDETVAQARRAGAILDRLRRWTRPTQSTLSHCSVNEVVRGVQALLTPQAVQQNTDLTLDLAPERLTVNADQVELEQVVFNLVRNSLDALSVAPERRVTLRSRQEAGLAVIEVSDTGPGVPHELRPRIFEPFVSGRTDGTGLGLALCQRPVERMQGEIVLRPSDRGARFEVRLPLAAAAGKAA